MVVADHFVIRIPPDADLPAMAPLLCAGITTFSPMQHWKLTPPKHVGVIGLGGLGHMAVKAAMARKSDVNVGAVEPLESGLNGMAMAFGRKSLARSVIGGIAETQEVTDYCAARNIKADIELIRPDQIAYDRVVNKRRSLSLRHRLRFIEGDGMIHELVF
jgi:D-arabinose 1-dehydrogenase-like Zn-dependent alcohol dehydrogenase